MVRDVEMRWLFPGGFWPGVWMEIQEKDDDIPSLSRVLVMNGLSIVLVIASLSWQFMSRTYQADAPEKYVSMWSRCYEELGCVNNTPEWYHPVYRPLNEPPLERHIIKTTFRNFARGSDRRHPVIVESLLPDYKHIKLTSYEKKFKTHVLIHDFTSNGLAGWIKHATKAMLSKNMGNVISVDWTGGAEPPYSTAVQNARIVGLELAYLIKILVNEAGTKLDQFHLIGMGIGAHIAAYAAERFDEIGRITGLDPSGLYFSDMPCFAHLDSEDAKLVDIIYTDVNKNLGQGSGAPFGHFNFYPNGALTQPGCNATSLYTPLADINRNMLKAGDIAPGCSHKRAAKYFIASIDESKDCAFLGYVCSDYPTFLRGECFDCQMGRTCAPMGYPSGNLAGNMSIPANVKLFLDTNEESPFCMYAYKIIVTLYPGDKRNVDSADKESDATIVNGIFCATIYSETEDLVFRTNLNMGASQKPFVVSGDNVYVTFQKGPRMYRPSKVVLLYDSERNDTAIFVSRVKVVPMPKIDGKTSLNSLCGPHELTRFVPHSQEEFTPCRTTCKKLKTKVRKRKIRKDDVSSTLDLMENNYSDYNEEKVSSVDNDDYYDNR